jgi:hypothetical protein
VASALETAKGRLAEAKRAYARAMADSRYDDGAELQEQIAEAMLEVRGLAWQHQQLEQAKHQPAPLDATQRFEQRCERWMSKRFRWTIRGISRPQCRS